jgi:uncharacterized protein (DUF2062 family)
MVFKKIKEVIVSQLLIGATPEKLTQSLSIGLVIGCCPFLGTATAMCFLTAFIFRLNHVAIQTAHYVIYPLQIILVPVYIKVVSLLFEVGVVELRPDLILKNFMASPAIFMKQYGLIGLYAAGIWLLIGTPLYFILYRIFFPVVVKLKNRRKNQISN